ncbi:phage tail protein [Loktanella sp. IMCC34160]|uniref:phage tail protein n=1 Tax=Loktanella sp. IMCC34160 TaxID=2510646 RepID=UPI00101DC00C|nr:tail fiber protein [Loktanella sp. IMCC34160]RYG92740.1 phage tail protein [Loktanella sp. IMCC34160]
MEPFIAQIMLFGGNFAPRGWAFCDGQLLPIASYNALFSILGTTYGGDGRTTFGLPDLRGRVPCHAGSGPGLTPRQIGQRFGEEHVTLTEANMPNHTHALMTSTTGTPGPRDQAGGSLGPAQIYVAGTETPNTALNPRSIGAAGGSTSHDNMQPTLCINYIIALEGVYPSRS